ncbi:hypothetical protein BD408DRAFT_421712 [Parasitella parasitica]|nr:hypothetical protein BD408DRAFT_421712 [Parasitella parasitica]
MINLIFLCTNVTSCSANRVRFVLRWKTYATGATFLHAFATFTTFDHTPLVGFVINAIPGDNESEDGNNYSNKQETLHV